jgi:hypothetical protein
MKYQLHTVLKNLDGTTSIKGPDSAVVTFQNVAVACLVNAALSDGAEKYECFRLAVKLQSRDGDVELEAEEVALLKRLIGASMPVVIVGRMFELLDQKHA